MIDFEKELEKFKPILNVDHIEEHITKENMADTIDLFKTLEQSGFGEARIIREMNIKE